jgi:hypothetical protein
VRRPDETGEERAILADPLDEHPRERDCETERGDAEPGSAEADPRAGKELGRAHRGERAADVPGERDVVRGVEAPENGEGEEALGEEERRELARELLAEELAEAVRGIENGRSRLRPGYERDHDSGAGGIRAAGGERRDRASLAEVDDHRAVTRGATKNLGGKNIAHAGRGDTNRVP